VQLRILQIVVLDNLLWVFRRLIGGHGARLLVATSSLTPSFVAPRFLGCTERRQCLGLRIR
jgi:hypothetical protein